jgi:hypothetical protein
VILRDSLPTQGATKSTDSQFLCATSTLFTCIMFPCDTRPVLFPWRFGKRLQESKTWEDKDLSTSSRARVHGGRVKLELIQFRWRKFPLLFPAFSLLNTGITTASSLFQRMIIQRARERNDAVATSIRYGPRISCQAAAARGRCPSPGRSCRRGDGAWIT